MVGRAVEAVIQGIAPDTITRLERAAQSRFEEAVYLSKRHPLAAVYLCGYCVEMCLAAAFFLGAGFTLNQPIDPETRKRRMAKARQERDLKGDPLMSSDPHPLPGWAKFVRWQRLGLEWNLKSSETLLNEAIRRAEIVYKHWRPELRYKNKYVSADQWDETRHATEWFIRNRLKWH